MLQSSQFEGLLVLKMGGSLDSLRRFQGERIKSRLTNQTKMARYAKEQRIKTQHPIPALYM